MSGGSGGSQQPSGSTTTIQKSEPWAGQIPFLTKGFESAQNLYDTGGPAYFPGATYAGPTDAQNLALQKQIGTATAGSPLAGASTNAAMGILSPEFLQSNPGNALYRDMANGPALQGAITSAVQNATPGLLDTFTQGNRLNSPGAAYAVGQGITNAAAPILLAGQQAGAQGLSSNYGQAVTQQNQANLTAPALQGMPYADISQLYGAGQTQQNLNQQAITDEMTRYNYGQTQPYDLLNWYNAAVGGSYGGTSTLETPYFTQGGGGGFGAGGALSGALSGASMGSMFGPWGAAGGGVLGGLLGGFM